MGSIAALLLTSGVPSKADTSLPTTLPDCVGSPQNRPTEVVFACADGGILAVNLKWTKWGASIATAAGTLEQNDCTPDCADGHFHKYKVSLTASGSQRCPNGAVAYAKVAYTVLDQHFPYPNRESSMNFPCRPMP